MGVSVNFGKNAHRNEAKIWIKGEHCSKQNVANVTHYYARRNATVHTKRVDNEQQSQPKY